MKTGIAFAITAAVSFLLYFGLRISLSRNKIIRNYFCERWWLHPNWICAWRVPLGLFGLWWYFYLDAYFIGILIFTISAVLDGVDGLVARSCDLITEKGKEIDPLADKLTYLPALLAFAVRDVFPLWIVTFLIAIEFFGQFLARPLLKWIGLSVAANNVGKVKTTFCFALIIFQAIIDGGNQVDGGHIISLYWLWLCVVLALGSVLFKFVSINTRKSA